MTFHKTRSLFVVSLPLLLLTMLSGSVHALMRVPDTECPKKLSDVFSPPHCLSVMPGSAECWRSESSIYQTSAGDSVLVQGNDTLDCENCDGCPENTPSAISCTDSLSVSYTEKVTATLANGNMAGANALKSDLEKSIGHHGNRTGIRSATCGTTILDGCKMQSYSVVMQVTEGIENNVNHGYQWRVQVWHKYSEKGDNNYSAAFYYFVFGCSVCNQPFQLGPGGILLRLAAAPRPL